MRKTDIWHRFAQNENCLNIMEKITLTAKFLFAAGLFWLLASCCYSLYSMIHEENAAIAKCMDQGESYQNCEARHSW